MTNYEASPQRDEIAPKNTWQIARMKDKLGWEIRLVPLCWNTSSINLLVIPENSYMLSIIWAFMEEKWSGILMNNVHVQRLVVSGFVALSDMDG